MRVDRLSVFGVALLLVAVLSLDGTMVLALEGDAVEEDEGPNPISWGHETIKCRVCIAAIDEMFREGVKLTEKCAEEYKLLLEDKSYDPEDPSGHHSFDRHGNCRRDEATHRGLGKIVTDACSNLHLNHDADHNHPKGGFRLTHVDKREDGDTETPPRHTGEALAAMVASCRASLFEQQSIEKIKNHLYTHLQSENPKEKILPPFRRRFCFRACSRGTRTRHSRKPKFEYQEDL